MREVCKLFVNPLIHISNQFREDLSKLVNLYILFISDYQHMETAGKRQQKEVNIRNRCNFCP